MNARRALTAAVLGAVAAGGLALFAGGRPWADVTTERGAPLPPVSGVLTGAEAAPLVPATRLVPLAAAVALLAVRGGGRRSHSSPGCWGSPSACWSWSAAATGPR